MNIRSALLTFLVFSQSSNLFAQESVSIGDRACLFLDDHFIAEQSGMKRTWHQGKPSKEVAIQSTEPWEKWPHIFGSVFYDPKHKVYRMYYESAISPARQPGSKFTTYICYAESKDGKDWTKPKLGLFEDLGSKENNIVLQNAELVNVFINPQTSNPDAHLTMFVWGGKEGADNKALFQSADGIHWSYVNTWGLPAYADPAESCPKSDTNLVIWDPLHQRYMAEIRTLGNDSVSQHNISEGFLKKGGKKFDRRAIGISISQIDPLNIGKGTPTKTVLRADDLDDQMVAKMNQDVATPDWAEFYVMPFFNYGNHYLGWLSILYFIDGSDSQGGGDLQLAFSHDGLKWFRPEERFTAIAPSERADLFPTYAMCNAPLEIGDELWVYYTEANGAHPLIPFDKAISQIRAATWRKDGFVSMDSANKGNLITVPLRFEGKELRVNFNTVGDGSLAVAILDGNGKPIQGLDLKDCEVLKGDAVSKRVTWKSKSDLSALKGKPVRLRFELSNGQLWSFRFAK